MPNRIRTKLVLLLALSVLLGGSLYLVQKVEIRRNNAPSLAREVEVKSNISDYDSGQKPIVAGNPTRILFLGDFMFDRYIRQVAEHKGNDFMFEKVDELLGGADLVVANLEGPITNSSSISKGSEFGVKENYIFTFAPNVATTLKKHRIDLVCLGNNHILNFKTSGVEQTEKYLAEAGVSYFGSPLENSGSRFRVMDFGNLKIAFVNYNQFTTNCREKVLEDIGLAKNQADVVVVYAHWGKEYETEPLLKVKTLAHELVDAGADLIIGSHPHVVQSQEVYRGKTIYYSLGNFIFDQYFQKETAEGLAVMAQIDPKDLSVGFQDFRLILQNNGQTRPQ
ncbi:CapA family protein [Patescibacteria group bacterium]|nr:MAG: CapA family protein [Patescibacteria group bacterium]